MIAALSIVDFVLIRRLQLEVGTGFTGLTGETGAGKSILLDAIGLALGMRPHKRFVRAGADRAIVSVEFDIPACHTVWGQLIEEGLDADPAETLILKRVVPASGAARGFINDQSVSSSFLREIGQGLIEIHGQHAASHLLKPSHHRDILDRFAGNDSLLLAHARAWQALKVARDARYALEAHQVAAQEVRDTLVCDVEDLQALAPVPGEAVLLAEERQQRLQAGRVRDTLQDIQNTLERADAEAALGSILGSLQRLQALPGFASADTGELSQNLKAVSEGFERAAIELGEAVGALLHISGAVSGNDERLEAVEARLFALRGLARKHGVDADLLADHLVHLSSQLSLVEAGEAGLTEARARETAAAARWHSAAEGLSRARKTAAKRFEKSVLQELRPLKLEKVSFRIRIDPLEENSVDAKGADRVEIEVETNPGGGYGPLQKIASGGELARISLALKCAAAETGAGPDTLIFDEADQGVGGAVAAAIGERLQRLADSRQVFAITHSPQVAAAAEAHWRIEKSGTRKALGQMRASVLESSARTEEIARMLSGSKVTKEARAAAERLLEG